MVEYGLLVVGWLLWLGAALLALIGLLAMIAAALVAHDWLRDRLRRARFRRGSEHGPDTWGV